MNSKAKKELKAAGVGGDDLAAAVKKAVSKEVQAIEDEDAALDKELDDISDRLAELEKTFKRMAEEIRRRKRG